jgi:predicted signal transduction protein with EAL and GGDEF domain
VARSRNTLHLQTVAEGIEHLEELTLLRHLGALVGQGYFFAKPLTASDAGALLERTGERPMIAALGRPARVAASAQRARLPRVALATTPGERLSVH